MKILIDLEEGVAPDKEMAEASVRSQGWTASEIMRILLLAGSILGIMLILQATPWGRHAAFRDVGRFREWIGRWGHWSWIMFLVAGTGLTAIGFPRIVLAAVAGAMFNVFFGILLTQIATTLSAALGFYYTRLIGRGVAVRKMGDRLLRLDGMLKEHGFMVLLLIRLCPVGNAFLTNCIAGVSAIGFGDYIAASFLGFLPETVIFALLGGGFAAHFQARLWTSVLLLVLFSLGFIWYFKKSAFAAQIMSAMREEK